MALTLALNSTAWRSSIGLIIATLFMALIQSDPTKARTDFEHIVVFGDSLSDNGNGRFSNGPVWVELLAQDLGLTLKPSQSGGLNYAVGGARLDLRSGPQSLRAQLDRYLKMPAPQGRTLYVVYGGGNDVFAAIEDADGGASAIAAGVASFRSIIGDLVQHGAKDIIVPNLPDVSITPEVRSHGANIVKQAGMLTAMFNEGIDHALAEIGAGKEVRLYRLDVRGMAERARADPAEFGLRDTSTPCQELPSCDGFLFWDRVHPTTEAHARLAEAALRALQP
jgi:phospholipase/lecithinase/hemolysin